MRFESYIALAEKAKAYPAIAADPQLFMQHMVSLRPVDPVGYTALSLAVGTQELQSIIRPTQGSLLSGEQHDHNRQQANQLCRVLQNRGLKPFQTLAVVNCWFNALAWPFALISEGYCARVDSLPMEQKEALALEGDGYAAASLAAAFETAGDAQQSAKWRKVAYDHCDLNTMRWMEQTAEKSSMPLASRLPIAKRHAMLGDPEGLAAYAFALMENNEQENAFRLAILSAAQDSPAGHYALYRCLIHHNGSPDEAKWHLDMAAKGGYAPACEELLQQEPPQPEPEPEPEAPPEPEPMPEPEPEPVQEPDGAASTLFFSISGVWDQVDQEMFDMTGENAPDQVLVDAYLTCLCGSLCLCDPSEKERVSGNLIQEFCQRMPDFAQAGYNEGYLNERFRVIAEAMSQYRDQFRELYGPQDGSTEQLTAIEGAVVYEIIDQVVQPDETAEANLKAAIQRMFSELMENK